MAQPIKIGGGEGMVTQIEIGDVDLPQEGHGIQRGMIVGREDRDLRFNICGNMVAMFKCENVENVEINKF